MDSNFIKFTVLLMIMGCKKYSTSSMNQSGREKLRDFLISDVCLSATGKVQSKDPANKSSCPRRRDIRAGEQLPYYRTDFFPDLKKLGYQRSDSVPFTGAGREFILKTFDFGGPHMAGFEFGKFEDQQDGFDIMEFGGDFASYIHTKDGSGSDNYWAGKGCKLDDGWVLFPTNFTQEGFRGNRDHEITHVGVREKCTRDKDSAHVAWDLIPRFKFTGGQELQAISTHHFDSRFSSFELNYYTREYGATRWEAWVACPDTGCPPEESLIDANACNGPKHTTSHNKKFYRGGCRDWTRVVLEPVPYPREHYLIADYRICVNMGGRFDSVRCN